MKKLFILAMFLILSLSLSRSAFAHSKMDFLYSPHSNQFPKISQMPKQIEKIAIILKEHGIYSLNGTMRMSNKKAAAYFKKNDIKNTHILVIINKDKHGNKKPAITFINFSGNEHIMIPNKFSYLAKTFQKAGYITNLISLYIYQNHARWITFGKVSKKHTILIVD